MLLFRRGKVLKNIEEGLKWKAAGTVELPGAARSAQDGVFVQVPAFRNPEQLLQYIQALGNESRHVLAGGKPAWLHLRGDGVCRLPIDHIKAILQAASPDARSFGLDINPRTLEPGDVAGYRSIGVERFNFRLDSPYAIIDEPVRRARALGAFASVEVSFSDELSGRAFIQTVERALGASPSQICLSDERSRSAFGTELLEKAGEMIAAAGFKRVSVWAWTQAESSFDCLGIMLSGHSINLGPDAVSCRPRAYANPGLGRWLETRLAGNFEVIGTEGRLENWLALASGLYAMELRRDNLDCRMHRHVAALERMGVVSRKGGRPQDGWSMEFCHRAARAARLVMLGGADYGWPVAEAPGLAMAAGKKRG